MRTVDAEPDPIAIDPEATALVLLVISLADRVVQIAGITTQPDEAWMLQVARNLVDVWWHKSRNDTSADPPAPDHSLNIHIASTAPCALFSDIFVANPANTIPLESWIALGGSLL